MHHIVASVTICSNIIGNFFFVLFLFTGIRDDTLRKAYNILQTEVQKKLKHNAYSEVNLTKLFGSLMAKSQTRVS